MWHNLCRNDYITLDFKGPITLNLNSYITFDLNGHKTLDSNGYITINFYSYITLHFNGHVTVDLKTDSKADMCHIIWFYIIQGTKLWVEPLY